MESQTREKPNTAKSIDPLDFAFYITFLKKTSGYHLTEEKEYLLSSRLEEVLKKNSIPDIGTLTQALQNNSNPKLENDVIEAMTVNETFFFRDNTPFETFEQKIIPILAEWNHTRPYRIWSAACSTGQEPYSIAMILEDNRKRFPNMCYEIYATEINKSVLVQAEKGVYSDLEVHRGLPEKYRNQFFDKEEKNWRLADQIRRRVKFQYLNLNDVYDITGQFDLVLLRNVLIYFDKSDKEKILKKICEKMYPSAYLLLGAAEGIYDPDHYFQRCPTIQGLYKIKNVDE